MTMKCAGLVLCAAVAAQADVQVWDDAPDGVWGAGAANWIGDAGAVWIDGNTAAFEGVGGVVEVDGAVSAAGIAFQTGGYVIADANADATLTLTGAPVIDVANAGHTNTIRTAVTGSAGFAKTGNGVLLLAATNTYSGETVVQSGILRLGYNVPNALGAAGTGNGTVVSDGATLDFNGAYVNATPGELLWASGSGVDGLGALINTGGDQTSRSTGALTLQGNTVIGGPRRIDINDIFGNRHTFTKRGTHQFCVSNLREAELIIDEGQYTILNSAGLGGTTWGDTTVNGTGHLDCWNTQTVQERITFNGGRLSQGNGNHLFRLAGHMTVNSNVTVNSSSGRGVALVGFVDGPGGFTQGGDGWCILANYTNAYTGPTIVSQGKQMYIGWTNGLAGAWGQGVLTNHGDICFFSDVLSERGPVVNMPGGRLLFDRTETRVVFASNTVSGVGQTHVRYGADAVFNAVTLTDANLRVNDGNLTLTNGTVACFTNNISVADLSGLPSSVSNVTATLTIHDGCLLETMSISGANGNYGSLTGRIVQVGGTVRTTGHTGNPTEYPGEYDGLHLGHWPACKEFVYEMRGGELVIGNGYRLAIAVDGTGWFRQTGGKVYAETVVVNSRNNNNGNGRLTLEGGELNVGSNGISVGLASAPYLVEYAGGTVRAGTNFTSSLNATMLGVGAGATVFDTQEWGITLSGNLTGTGGLGKAGSGVLTLTGANAYEGGTTVLGGTLLVNDRAVLPDGAMNFGVAPNDAGGRIHAGGDLSLAGLVVGVANPAALDKGAQYTVATWGGALTDEFSGADLPVPWKVGVNRAAKRVYLFADTGTVMQLK